jgi:fructokinase
MTKFIGIELGGTKCICVLANADGEIFKEMRIETGADPDTTLAGIEAVIDQWLVDERPAALGIASFGPVDLDHASPTWGFITTTSKPGWQYADVAERIRTRYDLPVRFDTDVVGAALAEMRWGAGRGLNDIAYVTIGTGIGVGLIVDGEPVTGFSHSEIGHIRVPRLFDDSFPGSCPFHGDCVEGLASGTAISARTDGQAHLFSSGHHSWDAVVHSLVGMLHAIIFTASPRRILFGGGVVQAQSELIPAIGPKLARSINGYLDLPIVVDGGYLAPAGLGSKAGPLGAIALAIMADANAAQPG